MARRPATSRPSARRAPPTLVTSPPRFPLEAALQKLSGTRRLLIYMHDNPDPDALAAAAA